MQAEEYLGGAGRAFIQVVAAESFIPEQIFDVVRLELKTRKILKSFVWCS